MAETQRPKTTKSEPGVDGARFLIVEARYYEKIAAHLLDGALAALKDAAARYICWQVPGALEIPIAAKIALDMARTAGSPFHGVIALGCVIRGETAHFDIVANESARALMDLALAEKIPLGNGILTVETMEQADVRADPERGDKGGEAARAALALHRLQAGQGVL
jgi:6,7-dimethyl-8-ribityllumazine synthase